MATAPLRVEFMCDGKILKFTHNVPKKLLENVAQDSQRDPGYMDLFASTIKPIVGEHYRAAFDACIPLCSICQAPKTTLSITPMSWLHLSADPFVNVVCISSCNKPACDTKIRQNVQSLMANMNDVSSPSGSAGRSTQEIKSCRVCSKTEDTFQCGRCKAAFYCGKEHQKMDWPRHKPGCKPKVDDTF